MTAPQPLPAPLPGLAPQSLPGAQHRPDQGAGRGAPLRRRLAALIPPGPAAPEGPALAGHHRRLATLRTILALILREMTTRYGRSPGGYLWALVAPLGGILLLSVGFSLISRHPPLGTSFLLYFATGMMPFSLYSGISGTVAGSLNFSKALLAYPAVTWLDAMLARFLLNTLTSMMVTFILITTIMTLTETRSVLDIGAILAAMTLTALLGLGVGLMNCAIGGMFPVWTMIWNILSRPLFLASGVLLLYEDLPRKAQDILWYNPLLHLIGEMRSGFYPMYPAAYVNMPYVILITLTLIAFGLILIRRYHLEILRE